MRYVVTGGAGFIGSHLVRRLLAEGHEVIVVDDFTGGKRDNIPREHKNLWVYKESVLNDLSHIFIDPIDVVFHLAALPRPLLSVVDPKPAHEVNVTGTLNVLLHAKENKVKRVILTSSSSVYGEQQQYPTPEDVELDPMNPYALHKVINEQYASLFGQLYQMEITCLRLFNVYGPRMNPDGHYASLIPKFIRILKAGEQPQIYGDGKQERDYVFVEDVVDAYLLASKHEKSGFILNVGSGVSHSVNEMFEILSRKLNVSVKPTRGPFIAEPKRTLADLQAITAILGWKPKTSLLEGLESILW